MTLSPLHLWPWFRHTIQPNLSPKTTMSPSCIELVKSKPLPINFNLVRSASARGYKFSTTQYCLRGYFCQANFWRLESIPMSLPLFQSKRIFIRNNQIGPHPHKWAEGIIMTPPPTWSYKKEKRMRGGVSNRGRKRRKEEERERKDTSETLEWVTQRGE